MAEDFQQIQRKLANHLRDPDHHPAPAGVEDRRLAIYRSLFFKNVAGFISGAFPVLHKLYREQEWLELVRAFYARHQCHSPYFSEISQEFLEYLENEHALRDCDPPFMLELAHYEWVELSVSLADEEPDWRNIDPDGDLAEGQPVISPLARRLQYKWPVHRIGPDYQPKEPGAKPTWLVVSRDADDRIHFMRLNLLTALLLEKIETEPEHSGHEQLTRIAAELGVENQAAAVESGRQVMETMRDKSILLGIRR